MSDRERELFACENIEGQLRKLSSETGSNE